MTLNAIVKEDGTLIAKVPKSLWGKQVKVMINMGGTTRVSRQKRFLWEKMNSRRCKRLMRRRFQRRNLPMNYIVFDLEWNQSPGGKRWSNSRLPFEIIEIGAIKLNEEKEIVDSFQRLIKPQVYNWIHDSIHEVIHMNYKDLQNGTLFPQAITEFLEWCGEEYIFFTWGNQDVMELQRNMKYYGKLSLLKGPVTYYDVQKLFAIRYEENDERRALEFAADKMGVEKKMDFHRALGDAYYTACILQKIEDKYIFPNSSLDVYQNPKSKREEIHISYPTYDKYVSREFYSREKAMKDREVTSTKCPLCHNPAKRKIRWFMNNSKVYYSVSLCQEHGFVLGKIRIRRTEDNKYYVIKKLTNVTDEEADEIRQKRDAHRAKRRLKKEEQ